VPSAFCLTLLWRVFIAGEGQSSGRGIDVPCFSQDRSGSASQACGRESVAEWRVEGTPGERESAGLNARYSRSLARRDGPDKERLRFVAFHLSSNAGGMRRERTAGLGFGLRPLLGREPPWGVMLPASPWRKQSGFRFPRCRPRAPQPEPPHQGVRLRGRRPLRSSREHTPHREAPPCA